MAAMTTKILQFPGMQSEPADDRQHGQFQLARRYRRVLVLLSEGLGHKEVAERLGLQNVTAWNYIEDVFIRNAELRQRLAAHALTLLDEEQRNGNA